MKWGILRGSERNVMDWNERVNATTIGENDKDEAKDIIKISEARALRDFITVFYLPFRFIR